jgi:hypothetical protein
MKFAKSFLMGTGAVVLAGLVLTLVAPKAAHAIAATAVLVENTTSSPVPTQPILAGALFEMKCLANSSNCTPAPSVPAGYVFHATHQYIVANWSSAPFHADLAWFINFDQVSEDQGDLYATYVTASTSNHDFYLDGVTQIPACQAFDGQTPAFAINCILKGYLTH